MKALKWLLFLLCSFQFLFPTLLFAQTAEAERDQSRLPIGRFVQLLLGCVPLGFL